MSRYPRERCPFCDGRLKGSFNKGRQCSLCGVAFPKRVKLFIRISDKGNPPFDEDEGNPFLRNEISVNTANAKYSPPKQDTAELIHRPYVEMRDILSDEDIEIKGYLNKINVALRKPTKHRKRLEIAASSNRKKDENKSPKAFPNGEKTTSIPVVTSNNEHYVPSKRSNNGADKSSNITFYSEKGNSAISNPSGLGKINPIESELYIKRGKKFEEEGQYDLAIQAYEKAIKFKPDEGRAYLGAGINYEKVGRRDLAVRYYKTAMKLGNNEALEFLQSMGIK